MHFHSGYKKLEDTVCHAVSSLLYCLPWIESLNLSHNKISDAGAKALGKALETNFTFETLDSRQQDFA